MDFLEQISVNIIELNNMGVHAMEAGDHCLALQIFKLAMDCKLQEMLPSLSQEDAAKSSINSRTAPTRSAQMSLSMMSTALDATTTATPNNDNYVATVAAAKDLSRQVGNRKIDCCVRHAKKINRGRKEDDDDTEVFLYLRPIKIPPRTRTRIREDCGGGGGLLVFHTAVSEEDRASANTAIESSVLLYNLALVYHAISLAKSLQFYKMSLELVKDVLCCSYSNYKRGNNDGAAGGAAYCCCVVDPRLVMAIVNNLGHIHYVFGNFEASRNLFANLSHILVSMSASGDNLRVDGKDWAGLVLNTMIMNDTRVAPAA